MMIFYDLGFSTGKPKLEEEDSEFDKTKIHPWTSFN